MISDRYQPELINSIKIIWLPTPFSLPSLSCACRKTPICRRRSIDFSFKSRHSKPDGWLYNATHGLLFLGPFMNSIVQLYRYLRAILPRAPFIPPPIEHHRLFFFSPVETECNHPLLPLFSPFLEKKNRAVSFAPRNRVDETFGVKQKIAFALFLSLFPSAVFVGMYPSRFHHFGINAARYQTHAQSQYRPDPVWVGSV